MVHAYKGYLTFRHYWIRQATGAPDGHHRKPVLLFIALAIDFADLIPFNFPAAAIEALFLMYLGVPPMASVLRGVSDLVPVLEIIPWCTLTVLHRRFGLNLGGLSWLFNGQPHGNVPTVTINR